MLDCVDSAHRGKWVAIFVLAVEHGELTQLHDAQDCDLNGIVDERATEDAPTIVSCVFVQYPCLSYFRLWHLNIC